MDNIDPAQWKIFEILPDGRVVFDWHAIDRLNQCFELGVRQHMGCDWSHVLWEARRQIVDGLINGPQEVSDAIMRSAGVLVSSSARQ